MYKLLRPLLFMLAPEKAHALIVFILQIPCFAFLLGKFCSVENRKLERTVFGLKFKNPVGFAAGFDKNALVFNKLGRMGFAFVEIGTVTPKAQPGNPRPRSFRLKKDCALINRMGFNNDGLDAIAKRLKGKRKRLIVGGNIGKNTAVANTDAVSDYLEVFCGLYDYVDYFTVNVSCPNVCNLQQLQDKDELARLLKALVDERRARQVYRPVLVKISPDLSFQQIDDAIEIAKSMEIDGIVAVNTTNSRAGLATEAAEIARIGGGGLSGKPLTDRALEIVRYIVQKTEGKLPVIAVGGIMSVADAMNMFNAGASLIQLYTGYIYQGPALAGKIQRALLKSDN
ncbi:MAG: quinone-dependent dihydroorotate dehydrogenase [Prevotellaceae bacterium]|jgi:dihydroorotate dehydrogenase|nr:quinone-dependent dihydroorotate dehydrogenase [Prevotellaceae bacterium]